MKRNSIVALAIAVLSAAVLALGGCNEQTTESGSAMGTAIGLGHGNCVTEVAVIADGAGNVKRVWFDEIFPASNVYNNTALGDGAPVETVNGKSYYKYLRIGDKYFRVTENGLYAQLGAGENAIADLMSFYKTEEGVAWYYAAYKDGALYVCAEADDGKEVGGVKLADKYAFNTSYGSMRKRYSRYWSTRGTGTIGQVSGLGFNGNMDMLENYLLTYGFDKIDEKGSAIDLPNAANNGAYNVIGGVTTGATLSADTGVYLRVAKKAYEAAMEQMR